MGAAISKLPLGWVSTRLGELYNFEYGKSLTKGSRTETGSFPVFGSSGIVGTHNQFLLDGPAIIIGRKGAAGSVHYSADNCWPIDTTYFIRDSENLSLKFSYYLLLSLNLEKLEASTAIPGLNRNHAYDEIVLLPPLPEQHRIVAKIEELFSELDKGVENLKTAQTQLKVYRQALLKHAFEGKLTAQWRADNPDKLETADALLKRIQQERAQRYRQQLADWDAGGKQGSKPKVPKPMSTLTYEERAVLPELPKEWLTARLGLMTCSVEYGTAAKSAKTGACPVLRMGNIQNGKFDWTDLVFTDDQAEISKYMLMNGDVLFNRTNSPELVGKSAYFNIERPAVFAGYLIRVNQITTIADGRYVSYFLNSHIAKQHGNRVKTDGVNQSNINGDKLVNYPFPFCSLKEQKMIIDLLDARISEVDQLDQTLTTSLQQAEALRQSILKKAFSGQLVPQDPHDEPASALLARIKAERNSPPTPLC